MTNSPHPETNQYTDLLSQVDQAQTASNPRSLPSWLHVTYSVLFGMTIYAIVINASLWFTFGMLAALLIVTVIIASIQRRSGVRAATRGRDSDIKYWASLSTLEKIAFGSIFLLPLINIVRDSMDMTSEAGHALAALFACVYASLAPSLLRAGSFYAGRQD